MSISYMISIILYHIILEWPSWPWTYCKWIYHYLRNQCLSPLTLWVRIPLRRSVIDKASCDKVYQWLATGRWFSPGTAVSSSNKSDHHDITEILLKVALNTITLTLFCHINVNIILLTSFHWKYNILFVIKHTFNYSD